MSQSEVRKVRYRMGKLERKNTLVAYSFLAPNFIGFAVFTLVPVICAIALSLFEWNGGDISKLKFVGLDNYATIFATKKVAEKGLAYFFNRADLGIALKNTVYYTVVTVPLTIICALALALLLNKIRGAVFFRTVFFFPYVSSMVAICVCWSFMLMKDGPVNQIIMALGINFNKGWTADSTMAIWSIILVSVWRNMGYYMVLYLAALQGIPRELMEAATVDGANKWQQFWHVTLPQLKPTTFFVSVMMVISCFKIYDVVAIMTDGGPGRATKMLVTYIYDEAFIKVRYGQASAISMVLLVIVLLVTIIQFGSEKKFSND
ncbi:carbohydrate ABC transporter membrane protein 1, CUT1 family [Aristaeella hokkaidonensis]|uniref:Sugar ABC transporter permease n=2 Tax=Aristaeella hokkaidonensis TaxID=3046382 RepID=A0AC61NLB3_9FIRM|nr:sugar ABC transporter permease [Aristaeella hokkaidonensis]MBQ6290500.1 sugar ABC transporter permease [Clostridia bacterium]QTE72143.1 sugar ABC transporter permease [Clostridiales bacterium FE2011]QTE73130.1 sugar ABC transporter permease [Clostridiales bacterium FE2010]QUC67208.1 sugar ABC transporter permease [Aristaeella hokkaidonensis]SNT93471.1 carbohydrate ABC transporter membrane protein 1, CUT1 family [Aristaeella hokkaidonensis]